MINLKQNILGIKELKDKVKQLEKIIDKADSKELKQKWNKDLYNDWYKLDRVKTFKTAGKHINKPFPRVKRGGKPYKKYRKYSISIGYSQGVWSGASYFALQKETSAGNRKYFKRITHSNIIVRLSGKNSNYLNLTLGISDSVLNKHIKRINKYLEKQINGIK